MKTFDHYRHSNRTSLIYHGSFVWSLERSAQQAECGKLFEWEWFANDLLFGQTEDEQQWQHKIDCACESLNSLHSPLTLSLPRLGRQRFAKYRYTWKGYQCLESHLPDTMTWRGIINFHPAVCSSDLGWVYYFFLFFSPFHAALVLGRLVLLDVMSLYMLMLEVWYWVNPRLWKTEQKCVYNAGWLVLHHLKALSNRLRIYKNYHRFGRGWSGSLKWAR